MTEYEAAQTSQGVVVREPQEGGRIVASMSAPFDWAKYEGKTAAEKLAAADADTLALARRFAASDSLFAACRRALPIVEAMCNTLAETCPPEWADALGSLRDVLALFPED